MADHNSGADWSSVAVGELGVSAFEKFGDGCHDPPGRARPFGDSKDEVSERERWLACMRIHGV